MRTIFFAHDQQESPEPRKHFLELAGYVVRLFSTFGALESALVIGPAPDLLLIDSLLEGKNGFETAREISQRHPERTFPLVLCSQIYRTRPFREEALSCGAQDYLLLPMPPDEFLRRVNQAIGYFVPPKAATG
ncbi:MAG: response regulator [Planctomycetes bacterium]|nr:response regulator [Planctomycetota bacterium]